MVSVIAEGNGNAVESEAMTATEADVAVVPRAVAAEMIRRRPAVQQYRGQNYGQRVCSARQYVLL